jgi:hypothetical protein
MAALPRQNERDLAAFFMNIKERVIPIQNAQILACMLGTTTFESACALP